MKQILHQIANVALVGVLTFGGSASFSLSKTLGPCLSPVEAQNATRAGRFLPFNQIKRMNGVGDGATVLNRQVCMIDGQPYYKFTVLSPSGPMTNYELRATDGSPYIAG
ncbi:MAG: hypothetical protein L3J13_01810 [Devosiaceae bacterium]|nr:hypothetical protein [Devosiaceae bacterium]